MRVEEISSFDSSFKSESSAEKIKNIILKGICDSRELKAETIFFCSHIKFWKAFLESEQKNVFLIFEESTLKSIEDLSILDECLGWGTVSSVSLAMSYLSKPFYEHIQKENNDDIDGRKTGSASIHPSAIIAENVFIGANVVIEEGVRVYANSVILSHSKVGKNTTLYPSVTLMHNTVVGENTRVHSGTVIGSDGFGYNFKDGVHHKVWHSGGVRIGNNVEIGSNCSIDQGTFSPTIIGDGCKLDNLVQIGHNVILKNGVVICGQGGVAGSTTVGEFTVMGGQGGIAPDLTIGPACQIGGRAGVISSLEAKQTVAGFPARPIKEWLKGLAYMRKNALNRK